MIHHVQLACPADSEDTLRAFYSGVLGLQEVAKPPVLAARGGCWFRGHGIELHLGVEHDFRPARKAHPGLLVHDLDAWRSAMSAAVASKIRRPSKPSIATSAKSYGWVTGGLQ
ncbi:MAG TPA: glyoxalase [Streptosporangiaceae bacterium]|nr:glyoxalase [Streptosporangiaceae bacterium]